MVTHVDPSCRFRRSDTGTVQLPSAGPEVAEASLELVDLGAVLERGTVPRHDPVELEAFQLLKGFGPFDRIAVSHVGRVAAKHVAGNQHAVVREVHDHVAAGVCTTQEQDPDRSAVPVQRESPCEYRPRRDRSDGIEEQGAWTLLVLKLQR